MAARRGTSFLPASLALLLLLLIFAAMFNVISAHAHYHHSGRHIELPKHPNITPFLNAFFMGNKEDGTKRRLQKRAFSFLLKKREGEWRKIPIQSRFASFGTQLLPPHSRLANGRSSILRYGRSV